MSAHTLSERLDISKSEAENLINDYFRAFPNIRNFLTSLGSFGKSHGFIKTYAPYSRVRWFDEWEPYLRPGRDDTVLGSIERRSKNTPIQGEQQCPGKRPLNGERPEKDNPVLNQVETLVNA